MTFTWKEGQEGDFVQEKKSCPGKKDPLAHVVLPEGIEGVFIKKRKAAPPDRKGKEKKSRP